METRKPRVGITHGDTNGIGYELILKTFAEPEMFELCTPIVYGSPKVASYHRKAVDSSTNFCVIQNADEAVDGKLNLLTCFDEEVKVELGQPTPESGRAAFLALEKAVSDCREGLCDVLVTAPICKSVIQNESFAFPGHTEYLAACCGEGCEPLMILCNGQMRVALATTHAPIAEVAARITPECLQKKIALLHQSLCRDFGLSAPRIAVLALNPHAGDGGLLGKEEEEVIKPVIAQLAEQGMPVFGPYPADGFFGAGNHRAFDGILAMYHDQGLAPFKALSMADGVNFTAGLDFVRTSPDHGTAFDIAGKGVADESSLRAAVFAGIDIFRCRFNYDEARENPLPKLYVDHREDKHRRFE